MVESLEVSCVELAVGDDGGTCLLSAHSDWLAGPELVPGVSGSRDVSLFETRTGRFYHSKVLYGTCTCYGKTYALG